MLDALLDKYEHSSHALSPGAGTRRVMINCMTEKRLIYRYEDASAKVLVSGAPHFQTLRHFSPKLATNR